MAFLSARALTGLKNYKYKAAGYTLLDEVHQPFWNRKSKLILLWLMFCAIKMEESQLRCVLPRRAC